MKESTHACKNLARLYNRTMAESCRDNCPKILKALSERERRDGTKPPLNVHGYADDIGVGDAWDQHVAFDVDESEHCPGEVRGIQLVKRGFFIQKEVQVEQVQCPRDYLPQFEYVLAN
ncbi:MAG: hypothetical protein JWM81_54 [Candidatus Saccharibacteria bacterium]|nr:hypothetical protein [Candidatus Saccharibacteria bacterium]